MKIKLLAFGQIADLTGQSESEITDVINTDELKQKLSEQFPELSRSKYSVAVNKKIVQGNAQLNNGDTVALLPPFSGG